MLATITELSDYTLEATDGEIGFIDELYFQEEEWQIRYLVIGLGNWFTRQHVLLVPGVIDRLNMDLEKVNFKLTREQIKNSPDVLSQLPVSREKELALHRYYQWQPYWMGHAADGISYGTHAVWPEAVTDVEDESEQAHEAQVALAELGDVESKAGPFSLRSTNEVTGYYIRAVDGEIGHIDDFVIDLRNWRIRYLVVDTRNWLPGRRVLVASDWIQKIDWQNAEVSVSLTKESVEKSPEYDPSALDDDYEAKLEKHYAAALPTYRHEGLS